MTDDRNPSIGLSPTILVGLVCTAQVLVQLGTYAYPALLPDFVPRWDLDNSEAGAITATFYAGYTCAVPILVTLTDRIDPKRVYLFGVACIITSYFSFGLLADGFLSGAVIRALNGIGWAGTYMTGLKMLADRVEGRLMIRAVSWHAAGIGVAGALSYVLADQLDALIGWRWTFVAFGASASVAWLAVFVCVPGRAPAGAATPTAKLFDFRPVFRNKSALAYSIAYCVHTWEMMAFKGWSVAFLAFVAIHTGGSEGWIAPTTIATIAILAGVCCSLAGNEISIRFGRQRLVRVAMGASILVAACIGFVGPLSYALAAFFILAYSMVIWLDSSALTAGAAGNADPARRGATLAVHSMLGYGGGFVGPLALGVVLDGAGGMSVEAWGYAFAHLAIIVLAGRTAFVFLRPRDVAGDRESQH